MRLFAAIDFDERARLAIAAIQADLGRVLDRDRLRWVHPDQAHITLVFLGDVSPALGGALTASLGDEIRQPAFEIVLAGLGAFPPRGAPRAVWVGVRDGGAALQDLQREMAVRVKRVGLDPGSAPFRPHLTLGRFRRSRPSDRHPLGPGAARHVQQRVDHVTLYESVLSSGPARYVALARANLTSI